MASIRENLTALVALQDIDRQILRAKKAQAALDNGAKATAASTEARGLYDAKHTALQHVTGDLKDAELKSASVEQKLKTYQGKLYQGTITNAKELANIEKEIAMLGRQRSDLDGRILELMDEVDQKKCDSELALATSQAAEVALRSVVEKYKADYEKLSAEIVDLTKQRAPAVAAVGDAALLKRYDDLRAKSGGVGIVQVVSGNCGGCGMTLPTAQVKHVKDAESVEVCENCGRLLGP